MIFKNLGKKTAHFAKTTAFLLVIVMIVISVSGCDKTGDGEKDKTSSGSSGKDKVTASDTVSSNDVSDVESDDDTSSNEAKYIYEEVVDEDASFPQTAGNRVTPITKLSSLKTSKIGFGYYGVSPNQDTYLMNYEDDRNMVQSDYVNTCFASSTYSLKLMREHNCKAWVNVYDIFIKVRAGAIDWKDSFDEKVQNFKDEGVYDVILGWYLDEPTDHQAVLELTKYAWEAYGKRFFICYLACSVAPDYKTIGSMDPVGISKETTKYLTDIAYDIYWNFGANRHVYQEITNRMHSRLGNPDTKVWYIPYIALWGSAFDGVNDDYDATNKWQIEHLEGMYEMLKNEENPGGLMCYTFYHGNPDYENQYGWKQGNQFTDGAFMPIYKKSVEIGREICTGKSGLDIKF